MQMKLTIISSETEQSCEKCHISIGCVLFVFLFEDFPKLTDFRKSLI